ncbi:pseudouridine synthase [Paracnuella aquatica]|uniref:pseudouridine synthase n=1 Tax=Paracnuella aquatica TaxID=2268757 RepID=UPI000DEF6E78|nr:pseudouridine synthase [Paracnuella aquatica]RPD49180.1 rRNA pseudouridine synthase [Paracnuella aquatica]
MEAHGHRYFVLNKPAGMVSQFSSPHNVGLLGDLRYNFPEGIHAIGRLDKDSEGLLLLTTNKKITRLLFNGPVAHRRTYLVQVRNKMSDETVQRLRTGVHIPTDAGGMYRTPPCDVAIVDPPADLFPSPFPVSDYIQHTWVEISLTEGKYRQVRKMVSAVRHRCMRLIRTSIEDLQLGDLQPGAVREIGEVDFFTLLKLEPQKI